MSNHDRALDALNEARVQHRLAEREVTLCRERLKNAEETAKFARIRLNDAEANFKMVREK